MSGADNSNAKSLLAKAQQFDYIRERRAKK